MFVLPTFLALTVAVAMLKTCSLAAVEQLTDGQRPPVANLSTFANRSYNNESATKMGDARKGRKFFGKLGFLAGLHIGSGISSSGSLAASHSVKVFGKVMNTALSVSYGPERPPGVPGGPGPILHDPIPPPDENQVTGKPVPIEKPPNLQEELIQNKMIRNSSIEESLEGSSNNENRQEATEDNEVIVEEVEPPPTTTKRTLFQYLSRRQASIEQKPNTNIDRHRIEFLKDHHRHIATFNQHFQKLSGDVSKVVRIAGG